MAVTKEQLADWRNHIVTQELMSELIRNREEAVACLVRIERERNYDQDTFNRAYIEVAGDVTQFQPEIIVEHDINEVQDVED